MLRTTLTSPLRKKIATLGTSMQRPATLAFTKENDLLSGSASSSDCDDYIQSPDNSLLLRGQLETFLARQLNVGRLNAIHECLERAGLPGRLQPLHHQKVLGRSVLVGERIDLQLVW